MLMIWYILGLLLDLVISYHYRGSMITWRIINELSSKNVTVEIFQRHAWEYTRYSPYCNETTILNQRPLLGSGNIQCVSTCPTGISTLGSVVTPCKGYSVSEGYAAGEGRFTFNVKTNVSFVASFTGNGWFTLVVGTNAAWSVAVQIQTYKRSNGRYNNAPIVTMLPIYRLRLFKTYVLKINVADNDFDPYRCLWSNGTTQCGGLVNSVPGAILNETDCYLTFTPQIAGYYAVALTIVDFETSTSPLSAYLSQVPIQFIFHVYNSSNPCWTGPIYVGDLQADMCLYLQANTTFQTRIRLQVQCPNATVTNIISVNPTGLTSTSIIQDPFDQTMFIYIVSYVADAQQYGQNLYCFSGVDSIGNQGSSTCLRFIIESSSVLFNPLYTQNMTRYPIGTVPSNTSTWTILTGNVQYTRPNLEAYIRFKRISDGTDVYRLNVVTEISNVLYLSDRLVIISNVIWTSNEKYYIYFDAGVLALASTCTKRSMPIIDPTFWPFDIPFQTTVTTTTSTSTTSVSTTIRTRSSPILKSISTKTTTTLTTRTTSTYTTNITTFTSTSTAKRSSPLSITEITGITLASLFGTALFIFIILHFVRIYLIHILLVQNGLRQQIFTFRTVRLYRFDNSDDLNGKAQSTTHYKLKTNKRINNHIHNQIERSNSNITSLSATNLVEIDI